MFFLAWMLTIMHLQDIRSTRILKGFDSLVPPDCTVIRDGVPTRVPSKDLVVGDVVVLSTGARVPSDMRVVLSRGLRIDKSMLTGEAGRSFSQLKPFLYILCNHMYECVCLYVRLMLALELRVQITSFKIN
jgi:P-type E1-E2 ATPase